MTYEECLSELKQSSERRYADFSRKLIPGEEPMLGVRIPTLRRLAKCLAKEDYAGMLRHMGSEAVIRERTTVFGVEEPFFEEYQLGAMIIGYARGETSEILRFARAFVPHIRNWSVNDTFCQTLTLARRAPQEVWDWLVAPGLTSCREYEQRVAAVLMMSHYLNEKWVDRVLYALTNMGHEGYYADMGIAWAVATAYAKFPERVRPLIADGAFSVAIHNKAIRKMIESYRVSLADKDWLRTMRKGEL